MTHAEEPIPDAQAALHAYLEELPPQRILLRGVREQRPYGAGATGVTVGLVHHVDVVTVVAGVRVARRFAGVDLSAAMAMARSRGHDVVERSGNIT